MKIAFKLSGPQLADSALQLMERQIKCTLPSDYRRFLLKHNGGIPNPKAFYVQLGDSDTTWVDELCHVDENLAIPCEQAQPLSIAFERWKWQDKIPSVFLVIGISGRDNLLLLEIKGKRKGEVWLKVIGDLSIDEDWTKVKSKHLRKVADSFSAFLGKLHVDTGK